MADFRVTYANTYLIAPFSLTADATRRVYGSRALRFGWTGTALSFWMQCQFVVSAVELNNVNVAQYGISGGTGGWYRIDGGAWQRHPGTGNHVCATGLSDTHHVFEIVLDGIGQAFATKIGAADNTEITVTGANPSVDNDPDNYGLFIPASLSVLQWALDPEAADIVAMVPNFFRSETIQAPSDDHGRWSWMVRHKAQVIRTIRTGSAIANTLMAQASITPFHQEMLYNQQAAQKVSILTSDVRKTLYSRPENDAQTLRFWGKDNALLGFTFSGYPSGENPVLTLPARKKVAGVGTSLTVHQESGPNGGGPGNWCEMWTASLPDAVFLGRGWGGSPMVDWGNPGSVSEKAGINQADEIITWNPDILVVSHLCNDLSNPVLASMETSTPGSGVALFKSVYKQFLLTVLDGIAGASNLGYVFCCETEGLYQAASPYFTAALNAIQEAVTEANAQVRAARGPNPHHVSGDYCFFIRTVAWKSNMTIVSGRISSGDGIHPTYEGHAYCAAQFAPDFNAILAAGPYVFGQPQVGSKFIGSPFVSRRV